MGTKTTRFYKAFFRSAFTVELAAVLVLSGLKWLIYSTALSGHCEGLLVRLQWKSASFCATSFEFEMWKVADYALIVLGMFALTAVAAFLYSEIRRL
ncbi:hypothetical protein BH10PSE15_BH10PSE15_05750 [soil metagenome]